MNQLKNTLLETPFQDLMANRVRNILLICSKYDRFMLEEDGRVEELLFQEYVTLGLRYPPKITHVSQVPEALNLLKERQFELVITMLSIGDTDVQELAKTIKDDHPELPIIVLSPAPAHKSIKRIKEDTTTSVDYVFTWQGNPNILLAMVKLIEDSMNAANDVRIADVQVIILVEDSVRYYSTYLPMIYTSLIQQARFIMSEGLNDWSQTQRMRGRPKILLARNFEEAVDLYETYKKNLLGIISDVTYKRENITDKEAGVRLCEYVRRENPDLPILLQSSQLDIKKEAERVGFTFIYKHSRTLLAELRAYIKTSYGFGNFVFRDPQTQAVVGTATNLRDLQYILPTIPLESFIYHVNNNDISKWLKARALFSLARQIRPKVLQDYACPEDLLSDIIKTIRFFRQQRGRGVIARFNRDRFDELSFFTRIGSGSLGGKGRGLAFIDLQLKASGIPERYPNMYISIPRTIVITTDQFDLFMDENDLHTIALSGRSDEDILGYFLKAKLPGELVENLKAALRVIKAPIAVRSSSLLEDSHYQPFAGIYSTSMLPNNHPDFDVRVDELCKAVKSVYASVFFKMSKDYLKATDHMAEEEKMAVVIQQVTGSIFGDYCYPTFSGVARSLNYYPIEKERPEDGIVNMAFGFGKIVVESGNALRFSPKYPKKIIQLTNPQTVIKTTQHEFFALDMTKGFQPNAEDVDNLERRSVQDAIPEGSLKFVSSTYDMRTGALSDSPDTEGKKVITFAPLLRYNVYPIARIIQDLLRLGEEIMNTPIEIEFAGNLNRSSDKLPEFSLLQIRPIVEGFESGDITIDQQAIDAACVHSQKAMGNGKYDDLYDFVYIKPEVFDPGKTKEMAQDLDRINTSFEDRETGYILVVAGRLGSSDPWLGIPTTWNQISHARVIVETGLKDFQVEPSQGTHFFQNLTSLRNAYMTINPIHKDGKLCLDELDALPSLTTSEFFRHVRTETSFTVMIDGKKGKGVILTPGALPDTSKIIDETLLTNED